MIGMPLIWLPPIKDAACIVLPGDPIKPTVHILHGFEMMKEEFIPFAKKINDKGYPVILCDHRGHGKRPGKKTDWEGNVEDVKQRLHLDNRPSILIGHSMGGTVATRIGAEEPLVQQVFAMAAIHGSTLFSKSYRDLAAKAIGLDPKRRGPIADKVFPAAVAHCTPELQSKFYFLHHKQDLVVPFSEFQHNVDAFCTPPEHTLVFKNVLWLLSATAHFAPAHVDAAQRFVLKNLQPTIE